MSRPARRVGRTPGKPATTVVKISDERAQQAIDAILERRRRADDPAESRLSADLECKEAEAVVRFVIDNAGRLLKEDLEDAAIIDAWLAYQRFRDALRADNRLVRLSEAIASHPEGRKDEIALGSYGVSPATYANRVSRARAGRQRDVHRPNDFQPEALRMEGRSRCCGNVPSEPETQQHPSTLDPRQLHSVSARLLQFRRHFDPSGVDGELDDLQDVLGASEITPDFGASIHLALRAQLSYCLTRMTFTDAGDPVPLMASDDVEANRAIADARKVLDLSESPEFGGLD